MNEKHFLILEHCRDDFVSLKALVDRIPRSSLYGYVKELVKDGFLDKRKAKYRTSKKGLSKLADKDLAENEELMSGRKNANNQEREGKPSEPGLGDQVKGIILENGDTGLDYDSNMVRLKEELEEIGVGVSDVGDFIQTHKTLSSFGITSDVASVFGKEMKNQKLDVRGAVRNIDECLRKYGSLGEGISFKTKKSKKLQNSIGSTEERLSQLKEEISDLGSTPKKIKGLANLDSILREAKVSSRHVRQFLRVHRSLKDLGFNLDAVEVLADELKRTKLGIKGAIKRVIGYTESFDRLERALKELEKEKKSKLREMKELEGEYETLVEDESFLKEDVKKLADRQESLKSSIDDMTAKIKSERKRYRDIQKEVTDILNTKGDANRNTTRIENLHSEKRALEKEIGETRKRLVEVQQMHEELNTDILACKAWRDFLLSGKLPVYSWGLWDDLNHLIGLHEGKADHLKYFETSITERVWKKMAEFHENLVKENVVSKWEHERLRNYAKSLERSLADARENATRLREENVRSSRKLSTL